MKNRILFYITITFALVLISAHFFRAGNLEVSFLFASIPLLFFIKKQWALNIISLFLFFGFLIWVHSSISLIYFRITTNLPWFRLTLIMTLVSLFTLLASYLALSLGNKKLFKNETIQSWPATAAFIIVFSLMAIAKAKASFPILLLERFIFNTGYIQILILSIYGATVTEALVQTDNSEKIRLRMWTLFSVVFFLQLLLGTIGFEKFLMTGSFHVPVPAVIIGGPIFRGSGYFMVILLLSTILLVGPAWCSHLCYFGAWDALASKREEQSKSFNHTNKSFRYITLFIIIIGAIILRLSNIGSFWAALGGILFGFTGVLIIIFISRKKGYMIHCLTFCPIGLVVNYLGKLSPFRIILGDECTKCGACSKACRYHALTLTDIKKMKPSLTCTLCGDCLHSCPQNQIRYKFLKLKGETPQYLFIALTVALHAAFLGLARV